jgi:hypothetical protein
MLFVAEPNLKIGLHEWIRTTSLSVPNRAVYQIDITQR